MNSDAIPFQAQLEEITGSVIKGHRPIGGGHICRAFKLEARGGQAFFLKHLDAPSEMFLKEARGLAEIRRSATVRVPEVLAATGDFLLLEFVPRGRAKKGFSQEFARQLAHMHACAKGVCGFEGDNFLGSTVQPNKSEAQWGWAEFFWHKRLRFQCQLAVQNKRVDADFRKRFMKLKKRTLELLDSPGPFSLLHGDLWSGNMFPDQNGQACLIDPAVHYGNREAELAMMELFGGFDQDFFSAYNREHPLPAGHRERLPLYQLYHIMNHLNLFGHPYLEEADRIVRAYL